MKKEISIKINYKNNVKRPWPSGLVTGISRRRAGFDTQREQEFFSLFSLFFFLIKRLG